MSILRAPGDTGWVSTRGAIGVDTLRGGPAAHGGLRVRSDWHKTSPGPKANVTLSYRKGYGEGLFDLKMPNGQVGKVPGAFLVFDLFDLAMELKGRRDREHGRTTRPARGRGGYWQWRQL